MKKRKKILSLLAAAVMTMTMVLPVAAADTTEGGSGDSPAAPPAAESTYTLTIKTNDKSDQHDFQAYQVFSGTISEDKNTLSDIEWGSGVKTTEDAVEADLMNKIKEVKLADGTQPFKDCTDAASVAEVLSSTRDESGTVQKFSKAVAEVVKNKDGAAATKHSEEDGNYTYKITGLKAGYYLVLDKASATAGLVPSANIIRLLGEDMEIDAKINTATVTKFSGEESADDSVQYSVGDTVSYTLRGTLPANYDGSTTIQDADTSTGYQYIFTDTFEKELLPASDWEFENGKDGKVTKGVTVSVQNGEEKTDVTSEFNIEWNSAEQTLKVGTESLNTLTKAEGGDALVNKDSLVIVKYNALLNAKGDTAGIDNKVKLRYGDNETKEVEETIFTLGLKINKVDGTDETKALKDAEFQLSRKVTKDNNTEIQYLKKTEEGKISWVVKEDEATTLTSDKDGKIDIQGIPAGAYVLKETKAPDGYNKLDKNVDVVISAEVGKNDSDKKVLSELSVKTKFDGEDEEKFKAGEADKTTGDVTITIVNNKGAVLPSTGGIGVKVLYVAGAILVIIAGVLLVTRKRMN